MRKHNLNAAHAQALQAAANFRSMPVTDGFQLNPRWCAIRELRRARLIRLAQRLRVNGNDISFD